MTESSELTIRPPQTPDEVRALYRLVAETFWPSGDLDEATTSRIGRYLTGPGADRAYPHGAYRGETFLGGYHAFWRQLRLGPALLDTVCIGAVATRPEKRNQGVARALLRHAVAQAKRNKAALLLLDGIGDFYHRFGFVDVLDLTHQLVERGAVLALPPVPAMPRVRAATPDDAPILLELYERYLGNRYGGFARTLEQQRHRLEQFDPHNPAWLAVDAGGAARGYLLLSSGNAAHAIEAGVADWPAALALLQHQARLLEQPAFLDPRGEHYAPNSLPTELRWSVPPDSTAFYLLADHLPVRGESLHRPDADWMARPADLPTLYRALLPLWQQRWQQHQGPGHDGWGGILTLDVDGEIAHLDLSGPEVRLDLPARKPASERKSATGGDAQRNQDDAAEDDASATVRLPSAIFTQLIFGYRPVEWATAQPGVTVPPRPRASLETLFPVTPVWIAGSDAF